MESNNELNEITIKNCTCYYFDEIFRFEHFDLDILIDLKLYEDILVYNFSYKTSIGAKPFSIRLEKIGRFTRFYDGTRYLVLFVAEKYDFICNRVRYLQE